MLINPNLCYQAQLIFLSHMVNCFFLIQMVMALSGIDRAFSRVFLCWALASDNCCSSYLILELKNQAGNLSRHMIDTSCDLPSIKDSDPSQYPSLQEIFKLHASNWVFLDMSAKFSCICSLCSNCLFSLFISFSRINTKLLDWLPFPLTSSLLFECSKR
jgi:hypothetical protein